MARGDRRVADDERSASSAIAVPVLFKSRLRYQKDVSFEAFFCIKKPTSDEVGEGGDPWQLLIASVGHHMAQIVVIGPVLRCHSPFGDLFRS